MSNKTNTIGFVEQTADQHKAALERIASRRGHSMNDRIRAESVVTTQEREVASSTRGAAPKSDRTPMTFAEWQELRRSNPHKYSREYRFMAADQEHMGADKFFGRPERRAPEPQKTTSVFEPSDLDDQLDPVDFDRASATADPEGDNEDE